MSSGGDPRTAALKRLAKEPGVKMSELTPYLLRGVKSLIKDGVAYEKSDGPGEAGWEARKVYLHNAESLFAAYKWIKLPEDVSLEDAGQPGHVQLKRGVHYQYMSIGQYPVVTHALQNLYGKG